MPPMERLERLTARWAFFMLVASIGVGAWLAEPLAPAGRFSPYLLALVILAVSAGLDFAAFRASGVDPASWARVFLVGYPAYAAGAWVLGKALGLEGPAHLGLFLLALAPPANTASVWTSAAGGDVAVALSGIALGNVVAPLLLALPLALAGTGVEAGTGLVLAWRILLPYVLVPALAGMALGGRDPFRGPGWQQGFRLLARIAVLAIMLVNAAALWQQSRPPLTLVALIGAGVVGIEGSIYALGSRTARRFRLPPGPSRAFSFLQSMRNTALVIALASAAAGPESALPAMIAFAVQEPLAALVAARLARRTGSPDPETSLLRKDTLTRR
ncbi:hypothetical protein LIP_0266 [Limnochorda pilosa]|uniref:Bile acid:sodium symporter n=2 Tax=Limnochorda pilosa TaxID=1555112 RepID=A0A0K2SG91_LIMPI|nr:hypothetical protein LIP_0266 [Limnochorda pilosa]